MKNTKLPVYGSGTGYEVIGHASTKEGAIRIGKRKATALNQAHGFQTTACTLDLEIHGRTGYRIGYMK